MFEKFYHNMNEVIIGKESTIKKLLIVLLSEGHILIEDVPGVGKTTIAKALAYSIEGSFARIQFTPDLLPSDILGVSIFNQKTSAFEYKKGPIFNQIILADEINRTSPKTQSSLLEAMEERQVTIDGITYKLQEPFMVIATQNPVEYEGTFALPEAQLDRFMMKIEIGYPDREVELKIFNKIKNGISPEEIKPTLISEEISKMIKEVNNVFTSEEIEKYIFEIIANTRKSNEVELGCSPRAAIQLYKCAKAKAFIENRNFVIPSDIKSLAVDVLSHRIIIKPEIKYKNKSERDVIKDIVLKTKAPKVIEYD
ncbi:MoxR family ATPase [Clostridiaceae bacterium HSG29]|nr:MoxR family ATPase [Clostridiaceae bacterium HSG29]